MDFGFMYSPSHMMLMKTVDPLPGHRVELMLNLHKSRLFVKFPLKFTSSHKDVESFQFTIPLSKMTRAYVAHPNPFCKVIILPLEAPPEFEAKTKDIRSTHDTFVPTWNEWQSWCRQTDIVEDRARLEVSPIRFRKEDVVIDIGKFIRFLHAS